MPSLTASNAVLMLSQPIIFPAPVQLQGFAADDVYDIPAIQAGENVMGVDGILSSGFVFVPVLQNITLQGDSASNEFFDTLWTQEQATQNKYPMFGLISLLAIGQKFIQTKGFLTEYSPAPAAKKILQPRRYSITWERIVPSPA
jgi:hypothetical protein